MADRKPLVLVAGSLQELPSADKVSMAGVSGTKAQFDAACSDDNFAYLGQTNTFTQPMNGVKMSLTKTAIIDDSVQTMTFTDNRSVAVADIPKLAYFEYIDASLANRLSAQCLRFIHIKDASSTGIPTAYDALLLIGSYIHADAPYQMHGLNAGTPNIDSGKTLLAYTGIIISDSYGSGIISYLYGIESAISSGSNRYNLRIIGTAPNIFNGDIGVYGASSRLGYIAGAGGVVTQATSKSTGVTLNRPSGQITMNNEALAAGASVSFTCTNSVIGSSDVVQLTSGALGTNYRVEPFGAAAGSFSVRVTNISAGSLSEALTINFAILRGATS